MPTISNALNAFRKLLDYQYHFAISYSKKMFDILLVFDERDFHHLAGFQYLSDIDIPKSAKQLFCKIDSGKINDNTLSDSVNYLKVNDSYANVKDRIHGLQYLREYIESNNIIFKYVKNMNRYSSIEADFMIKSIVDHKEAYIFIRKRSKSDTYCICSFFVNPGVEYKGVRSYWLYKSKINLLTNTEEVFIDKLNKDAAN
ncbi:hypothetical protein D7V83_18695 [bacterium 0.1xD8-71]|nr:hypothetical protein D7V83_18695 [bacterium 0.1xD8-71]